MKIRKRLFFIIPTGVILLLLGIYFFIVFLGSSFISNRCSIKHYIFINYRILFANIQSEKTDEKIASLSENHPIHYQTWHVQAIHRPSFVIRETLYVGDIFPVLSSDLEDNYYFQLFRNYVDEHPIDYVAISATETSPESFSPVVLIANFFKEDDPGDVADHILSVFEEFQNNNRDSLRFINSQFYYSVEIRFFDSDSKQMLSRSYVHIKPYSLESSYDSIIDICQKFVE